ncbi:CDP-alcohol phosphatidyltransferase family protein [Desulfoluna butyratoxydans]|uniref:Cdp-alcohol phosphatidyltransferase n=1 Tax=Desulfoluna butyratoxydans TaxID=231438 RepID=A0A4U8YH88_9BACT|nr:CDP-alcohol phosphatidyltransferase family protein [Desulfoluna butyratoxydans]VFQ42895.1 cdp-alcohol phosphatidyltransferase [Desulfoluna butyratoxydans]
MAGKIARTILYAVPNTLSLFRLACSPVILWFAWNGEERPFLAFLTSALVSDLFDGAIARMLKHTTELGAKLDSMADFLLALAVLPCIWWLWPHLLEAELRYFMIVLVGSFAQLTCGYVKFGRTPSYHTWTSKSATLLLSISLLVLLYTQDMSGPFRFSAILHLASTVESILITLILPRWNYNVHSIWHALEHSKDK